MSMLTDEENSKLRDFKVCIVGCGGLGGNILEMIARLGIGNITVIDGDIFDVTNLNRQTLSTPQNLGKPKSKVARERINNINPDIEIVAHHLELTHNNAIEIFNGHNIIIDAVDNLKTRFIMQDTCRQLDIPLVHGAISGWNGQVTVIMPGDDTFTKIYGDTKILENPMGNPSFTPGVIASIQVSEALKVLLNRGEILRDKLLYIDLLENNYYELDI